MELIKQSGSSAKYGLCEVCKKWADEVYSRKTYPSCGGFIFGHKECLERREKALSGNPHENSKAPQ